MGGHKKDTNTPSGKLIEPGSEREGTDLKWGSAWPQSDCKQEQVLGILKKRTDRLRDKILGVDMGGWGAKGESTRMVREM